MSIEMFCPVCHSKLGRVPHFSKCNPHNYSNEEYRNWVFKENYSNFIQSHKETIRELYEVELWSVSDLAIKYDIPWNRMKQVLNYLGCHHRSIAEAKQTPRSQQKYKDTCLLEYGAENALSKNTVAYHKRNQTVLSRYGVDNVRKTKIVQDKITQVCLSRFGVKRLAKLPKFSKITSNLLESRISSILTNIGIPHQFSKYVARRQFDFHITGTKILVEVQGDFWHANPKLYKPDDIIHLMGNSIIVEDIWEKDVKKLKTASKYGYDVIYLWEDEIRSRSDLELSDLLLSLLT